MIACHRALSQSERHEISDNCDIPEAKDFEDDACQFATSIINSAMVGDIYSNPGS